MRTVGIVAEYDPFHWGHLYQMKQAKERTGADNVVVVLGGDFLQRGTPSMIPKRIRARMAADAGADLVLELPYAFSVNSAREYAEGAVRILSGTGCVDYLSFGCENEDLFLLNKAASVMTQEHELSPRIKEKLSSGFSYPEAMTQALADLGGKDISLLLRQPNNLLACEYLRAVSQQKSPLKPVPIQRMTSFTGGGKKNCSDRSFLSASQLRSMMAEKGVQAVEEHIPVPSMKNLRTVYQEKSPAEIAKGLNRRMFSLLRYRLLTADHTELNRVYSVAEGFENRLASVAADPQVSSIASLVDQAGTRRYTRARILRMLIHILMNFKKDDFEWLRGASCARILAFSEKGRNLLARMRKNSEIPVLSNLARLDRYDARTRFLMKLDIRAAGLYDIIRGGNDLTGGEIRYVPYMRQ